MKDWIFTNKELNYERLDIINHHHAGNISHPCIISNLRQRSACRFDGNSISSNALLFHPLYYQIIKKQMTMNNPIQNNRIVNDETFAIRLKHFVHLHLLLVKSFLGKC